MTKEEKIALVNFMMQCVSVGNAHRSYLLAVQEGHPKAEEMRENLAAQHEAMSLRAGDFVNYEPSRIVKP